MNIYEMDFIKLLPAFMQDDSANNALSHAVNQETESIAARIRLLTTWDQIDHMSSAELDMLADELHISWYDPTATVEIKRQIVKDSDLVHSKLGTNWAANQVINTYFGEGKIIDWYEYGGKPHHFKVQTVNQTVLNSKAESFIRILGAVKRKSAVLDNIELVSDGQCKINVFVACVDSSTETYRVRR